MPLIMSFGLVYSLYPIRFLIEERTKRGGISPAMNFMIQRFKVSEAEG